MAETTARHKIDWEAMEPDWRAGIKTKKQLSEEYGVSRAAIDKHWHAADIERDLTAKIKALAETKVTRATVTRSVTPETKVTEREVVEANAKLQSDIILAHRSDIPRKRELVEKLFGELEGQTDGKDLLEQLSTALRHNDMKRLATFAEKITSLPSRIKGASDLISAYKTLIMMERQVFGIAETGSGADDPLAAFFNEVAKRIKPLVSSE
jgi:hypothetical protein